jgi:2',3'-cyclic-nucleotide 2'-phosphodiesterase/3'-nucleotidase
MDGRLIPVRNVAADPEISRILQPYNERVRDKMAEVLGRATGDLISSRSEESPLANMVADALRDKGKTQIAMHNIGGIRASISRGTVTWAHVFEVLPFQNTLVTMKLSGTQLKQILERHSGLLAVSGIRVRFDLKRRGGSRLVSLSLPDGTPVRDFEFYSLTTNDFLVAGGDGLTELAKGRDILDTGIFLRDAFVEYVRRHKVLSPQLDGRLVIN